MVLPKLPDKGLPKPEVPRTKSMDQEKRPPNGDVMEVPIPGSPKVPTYRLFPSTRIFMIFLAFCGMTAINCGFAAFNFAIVCMVEPDSNATQPKGRYAGVFDWDKGEQANLLAAQAWGGILSSIPAGWLSDKYGGKYVFLAALVVNTISTALSPWAAFQGQAWLFAARMFTGMAAGAGWPSVIQMATRWGSPAERASLIAMGTVGCQFGQLLTIAVGGVLCDSNGGWPSIFYIWSGLSGLIAIIWFLLYTDHSDQCRFISAKERAYLQETCHPSSDSKEPKPKVPWRYVLLAPTSMAIYMSHFCNIWLTVFSNEFVPTYGKEVLNLDIASNGFYSALPLLCQFVSCLLFGTMADKISCKSRSVTFSVKFFNTICLGLPCAGLIALSFLDESSGAGVAIFCLCFCAFLYASSVAGFIRCMVLIAPKFSGTISSVSNVYSYVACIAMPYVVGVVTADGTASEWHDAFYICLGLAVFGCVEFLIFGSGEEQSWSKRATNIVVPVVLEKGEGALQVLKF